MDRGLSPQLTTNTHDLGFRKLTTRPVRKKFITANLACCCELLKAAVGLQSDSSRFEPSQKFDKKWLGDSGRMGYVGRHQNLRLGSRDASATREAIRRTLFPPVLV
jgi:hypothetical protein